MGCTREGLTSSIHLKCHISCPTWPDILWIFKLDIMWSCQYCLVRYRPTSVHVGPMFIDYPNIVVLYKSEIPILNRWSMLIVCLVSVVDNWHTSLHHCQSHSINTIGLHRPKVFLMLGSCRKQWTNVKPILGQCIVLTMTQRWVYANPQSEMMSQHQRKCSYCNHWANTAGILILQKNKSLITHI